MAVWLGAFSITIALWLFKYLHFIPYGVYAQAGRHWFRSKPLYDLSNIDGFQYFPQAAIVFSVFARLGDVGGNVAWRAVNWVAYAYGLWRVTRMLDPERRSQSFLIVTALAVVPSTGSLANGQANLSLAALTLHVAVELANARWNRATLLLAFGLGLKPLTAPLLLLSLVLFPALRWRIPLSLLALSILPFALRDPAYVVAQYHDCWIKLQMCAAPGRLFEDLRSMLSTAGVEISHEAYMIVRGLAALAVLVLGAWTRRRIAEPLASFLIATYSASYLMLFNPRTLSSSYVMVLGPVAILAVMQARSHRYRSVAATLVVLGCWTVSYKVVPVVEHWLRPLAGLLFWIVLAGETRYARGMAKPGTTSELAGRAWWVS